MLKHTLTLQIFEPELAICRLPPTSPIPAWIGNKDFVSVTRTPDELSIVCYEAQVPGEVKAERNWRMLGIKGPLGFSMTGPLKSSSFHVSLKTERTHENKDPFILDHNKQLNKNYNG